MIEVIQSIAIETKLYKYYFLNLYLPYCRDSLIVQNVSRSFSDFDF